MKGDTLAAGGKSAQFGAGHVDVNAPVEFGKGIVAEESETFGVPVLDKRRHYNPLAVSPEVVEHQTVSNREFDVFRPIMDRVLIKRINEDPDLEQLEDGSARNKKTGLIIAAKYRQHSNVGIVLAAGDFVVIGGARIDMQDILKPGDKVTFGDYNSEVFLMDENKEKQLCESLVLNYVPEDGSVRIVRVQDIRGVERAL